MRAGNPLGRGPSFPLQPAGRPGAGLAYAEGPEKVQQAIRLILDTEPGERVMRPSFGCGLRRYLMQPNSAAVRALIRNDVATALGLWEPRIELTGVEVLADDAEPSRVDIHIRFVFTRDRKPGNLVYPFYLE